jgi:hypothetical protein
VRELVVGVLLLTIPFVVLAGLLVWITTAEQSEYDSYRRNCVEAGGHVYEPDETAFCLSDDGRWVEVYP